LTIIPNANAAVAWQEAVLNNNAIGIFRAAGLPAVDTADGLKSVIEQLLRLSPELVRTLRLPVALAGDVIAGKNPVVDVLRQVVEALKQQNIASVLPLVSHPGAGADEVLLVTRVVGLPGAGVNLSYRRASAFRWYSIPIQARAGNEKALISTVGSRAQFSPPARGLWAVVVIGYARLGQTDPYEFRVDLPNGANLNLKQYEFLMNILQRSFALGVEVNTFSIRQKHVDLGEKEIRPLPPRISQTLRPFQRTRLRGQPDASTSDLVL
jgi:hypothetical protein